VRVGDEKTIRAITTGYRGIKRQNLICYGSL
jgi:hypothetical protein